MERLTATSATKAVLVTLLIAGLSCLGIELNLQPLETIGYTFLITLAMVFIALLIKGEK